MSIPSAPVKKPSATVQIAEFTSIHLMKAAQLLKYGASESNVAEFLAIAPQVSSTSGDGKAWRAQRESDLQTLTGAPSPELLTFACSRFVELSELVFALRHEGAKVWRHYPVHGAEVFWFYRECLQLFHRRREEFPQPALVADFGGWLRELKTYTMES